MKDNDTAKQFRLKLRSEFEILQHSDDIEEQLWHFEEAITFCAAETIGKRTGTEKKCWLQARLLEHENLLTKGNKQNVDVIEQKTNNKRRRICI